MQFTAESNIENCRRILQSLRAQSVIDSIKLSGPLERIITRSIRGVSVDIRPGYRTVEFANPDASNSGRLEVPCVDTYPLLLVLRVE